MYIFSKFSNSYNLQSILLLRHLKAHILTCSQMLGCQSGAYSVCPRFSLDVLKLQKCWQNICTESLTTVSYKLLEATFNCNVMLTCDNNGTAGGGQWHMQHSVSVPVVWIVPCSVLENHADPVTSWLTFVCCQTQPDNGSSDVSSRHWTDVGRLFHAVPARQCKSSWSRSW